MKLTSDKRYIDNEFDEIKDVLDCTPGKLYWKDKNSCYVGGNKEWLELVGADSVGQVIGKRDEDFFGDQAAILRENDILVMKTRETLVAEEEVELCSGERRFYLTIKKPLCNAKGEVIGIMGNSIDITAKKQLEQQLIKAKEKAEAANAAKTEFIANMSHDFRTPITGMLGLIQNIIDDTSESTTKINAELLIISTTELLRLLNDILEVVQLKSGTQKQQPETFDLWNLVQRNVNLFKPVAKQKGLSLIVEINDAVPQYIVGMRLPLDRTLLNLIGNGLKFTKKGYVKVMVNVSDAPNGDVCDVETISLQIIIEDTGIGIPKDKHEVIFEHFSRLTPSYQGSYRGTGLGLYTVKHYMKAMRGNIRVESQESQESQGTRFIITVPVQIATHAEFSTASVLTSSEQSIYSVSKPTEMFAIEKSTIPLKDAAAHVLVVEDDLMAVRMVKKALEQLSCAVVVAMTGKEALDKVKDCDDFDLILMDVGLPDITGLEVTKRIRVLDGASYQTVPIIALTGHVGRDKREECIAAGMNDILNKPANGVVLQPIVDRIVFKKNQIKTNVVELLPVIDWKESVRRHNGNAKLTRRIFNLLSKELKDHQQILSLAYKKQDFKMLRNELHKMLGGLCYFSVPRLLAATKTFQEVMQLKKNAPNLLETTYQNMQKEMKAFWLAHRNFKLEQIN